MIKIATELNLVKHRGKQYIINLIKFVISVKKEMTLKQCQIDHISPLACGGTNDDINLQSICKECHFEKTQEEKENHEYLKIYDTNSSYDTQSLDIINSSSNLSK